MKAPLALLAVAMVAACGDSGSSSPPAERSTTLDALDATPLLGVLLADCTESGTDRVGETQDEAPPAGLAELPPADSAFGGELSEFLILLGKLCASRL